MDQAKEQFKCQAQKQVVPCSAERAVVSTLSPVLPPPAKVIKRQAFSAPIRRKIWNRAGGQCEFIGENGKRCAARSMLEFDHYPTPVALGGKSDEGNGRLACKTHNLSSAVQVLGRKCMQKWLPGMRVGDFISGI